MHSHFLKATHAIQSLLVQNHRQPVMKCINFSDAFKVLYAVPFSLCLPAAPEMLKGDVVGPPADIWSVGVLTFIM